MKKIYILACLFTISFSAISQSLLTDDFNFTGTLTTNGWSAHSGTGTNAVSTTSGLTYTGLQGSGVGNAALVNNLGGEDVNRMFTSQNTNGQTIFLSGLVNVTEAGNKTGDYLLHIGNAASSTSFTSFAARVFIRTTATGVNFGVSNSSTATYGTTDFSRNTVYLLIVKYTINTAGNDDVSLWIKSSGVPNSEAAAGTAEVSVSNAGQDIINAIAFRQGSSTTSPQTVVDALKVGLTWADVTPGLAVPTLSNTALTAFGNVCINTTAGPNSFTITGTNLTTADVTVGALAGFTYSTTSGGTYTTSLTLTQPGGAFSQQVFVKFDPTLVQSYNGNIVVAGGGATSINVAAAGSGVNTAPSVTTGSASAITQTSATLAGSITATGCTAVTAYGIEWSASSGFVNGTGTQVPASNLSGGNFSSDISGLTSGTTYYYKAYATNGGGTVWGSEQSFSTASPNPTISTTALASFGNVCINTTTGPNSFTINGTNLTTSDVTVASLAGYTFSTTSGGTYTASLTLTQTGGTYAQDIYVKFSPTAVQSYNGNIVIDGGGISAAVNVAVTGTGVNTTPTVTTGASSGITTTAATLAGNISADGCTAVSAYGIEWSTTNGFVNGTGTQVAATNITAGNYTSSLSGLTPSTTYYYKAYAANAGGTAYGTQQSFTTAAPPPPSLTATALTGFGNVCITTTTGPNSFTINGTNLTTANIVVGPLTGYTFDTVSGGPHYSSVSIPHPAGTYSRTVYVKFSPALVQSYNGNIPVTGGGTTSTLNVAVTGAGVNTTPTVTTGAASNIFTHYATLAGNITANGCSNVTAYGIEFSGINGFADGNGTKVPAANLGGGAFSATLNNLVQGATYYYKAYATNSGGTAYGVQQSFTVTAVPDAFTVFPVPAAPGSEMRFSIKNITPGYYGLQFISSNGVLVFQHNMNIQANFINQALTIPGTMARGVYQVKLVNHDGTVAEKTILIH